MCWRPVSSTSENKHDLRDLRQKHSLGQSKWRTYSYSALESAPPHIIRIPPRRMFETTTWRPSSSRGDAMAALRASATTWLEAKCQVWIFLCFGKCHWALWWRGWYESTSSFGLPGLAGASHNINFSTVLILWPCSLCSALETCSRTTT